MAEAEAAHPWPEYIHQSFNSAKMQDLRGREESVYFGPFTRLLYTLFSLDGPYEIMPQIKIEVSWDSDNNPGLVVVVNKYPGFTWRLDLLPFSLTTQGVKKLMNL